MPKFTKKLKRGETECYRKKMLLVLKWSDKQDVSMLTTVNTPAIVNTSKSTMQQVSLYVGQSVWLAIPKTWELWIKQTCKLA